MDRENEGNSTDALEHAAQKLHAIMERLDPTEDSDWDKLAPYRKQFYRSCLKDLIGSTELMELLKCVPTITL